MRQLVGWRDEERTVRDLLLSTSRRRRSGGPAARWTTPRPRTTARPGDRTGLALARAHAAWGDAGGWDAEVLWDTLHDSRCGSRSTRPADRRLVDAVGRRAEAARARGRCSAPTPTCSCSTSPTTTSTCRARSGSRTRCAPVRRRSCSISHDRAAARRAWPTRSSRSRAAPRGCTAARSPPGTRRARTRLARIDEEHRRWQEERKRLRAVAAGVPPARVDGQRQVRVARAGDEVEDRAVRGRRAPTERVRDQPGVDAARRRSHRQARGRLRAARAARPHRPVRHRGLVRRARRGARPERHRQEPLPPPARRASRSATRARGASARASSPATSRRPTTTPSSAASTCSTS